MNDQIGSPGEGEMGEAAALAAILPRLRAPFAPGEVRWRVGAISDSGEQCQAIPYVDLRRYQERLDAVCGPAWQVRYEPWGERLICTLTIHGVSRASIGEVEAGGEELGGKAAEAQAFRRACALFGLGAYLDQLPAVWVAYDAQARRIAPAGIAELQARYRTWYERTLAAQSSSS